MSQSTEFLCMFIILKLYEYVFTWIRELRQLVSPHVLAEAGSIT